MAGSANPMYTQATGQPAGAINQLTSMRPTPQAPVAQPANPYQQASSAQQAALGATQAAMNYNPAMINPAMRSAAPTAASQMGSYTNPYENQVVQATLRDIGGAQQQAMNQIGQQASAAGAFGGSRHGIAEAESNKAFNQQALDAAARMRAQGFNTALGASQFDVGNQMNVNAANVGAINAAQQQNIANQMAGNQARLGAAGQMANLGQQSFGYGQAIQNQQMQQGTMQQQLMQDLINQGKGMFQGYTQQPSQNLGSLFGAITGSPNVSGQSNSFTPGLFNYMQMFAGM